MSKPKNLSQGRLLDKLAALLGHICIHWSRLERNLDEYIEVLAPLERGDISRSVTANMDIREKIQTIKALAYLRKPSDEWFAKIILLLDYIDNDLRVRRNRFVHDAWFVPSGRLIRSMRKVRFERPQSFQLLLHTETNVPVKITEARQLAAELEEVWFVAFVFWWEVALPETYKPLPTRYFRRFVRRAKPAAPQTYVNSMQQHPPRQRQRAAKKS